VYGIGIDMWWQCSHVLVEEAPFSTMTKIQ